MMKNRHLSKAIQNQKFYMFGQVITYKSQWNAIKLVVADRFYPSSKKCSCCGNIKRFLKLSDRTYECKECGFVIDRDVNASFNLETYGKHCVAFC
jgi:putative transposase